MDKILWEKCSRLKAIKKERNQIKNGGKILASQKKTIRYEKHQAWWVTFWIEQQHWKRYQRQPDKQHFLNRLKVWRGHCSRIKKSKSWDPSIFV